MTDIQAVPAIQTVQPIRYEIIQTATKQEDKNFIEGLIWAGNGFTHVVGGIGLTGCIVVLDAAAVAASVTAPPAEALACLIGLAALNVLSYYVVKAEFSIAGKSFSHMANTIL